MLRQIEADLEDDNEPSEGHVRCLSLAEQTIPAVEFRPLRAGIFKAFGVYRPILESKQREEEVSQRCKPSAR